MAIDMRDNERSNVHELLRSDAKYLSLDEIIDGLKSNMFEGMDQPVFKMQTKES